MTSMSEIHAVYLSVHLPSMCIYHTFSARFKELRKGQVEPRKQLVFKKYMSDKWSPLVQKMYIPLVVKANFCG